MESEEGIETLNTFSITIATTDVLDCFHSFRMPLSLSEFFCHRAVPAHVLRKNDGRDASGPQTGSAYGHLAMMGRESSPWFLLVTVSGTEL